MTGGRESEPRPFGTALGQQVANVETFTDADGGPIYYIVYLQPSGFVIVPADDWLSVLEPIVERYRGYDIVRFFRVDAWLHKDLLRKSLRENP